MANTNSRREVTRSPGKQRQATSSRILLLAFDSVNDKGHPIISFFAFLTSNNQRLRIAGDNYRRSKRFCSIAVLCAGFTWQIVKTRVIRLRYGHLVEVQTATRRMRNNNLEIRIAAFVARKKHKGDYQRPLTLIYSLKLVEKQTAFSP